jgi:hypothetical protein
MVSIKDVLFNIELKVNADLESKVAKSNFQEIYRVDLSIKYWKMKICRILYFLHLHISCFSSKDSKSASTSAFVFYAHIRII